MLKSVKIYRDKLFRELVDGGVPEAEAKRISKEASPPGNDVSPVELEGISMLLGDETIDRLRDITSRMGWYNTPEQEELIESMRVARTQWETMIND